MVDLTRISPGEGWQDSGHGHEIIRTQLRWEHALGHVRNDHERPFQSLGPVNGRYRHGIAAVCGGSGKAMPMVLLGCQPCDDPRDRHVGVAPTHLSYCVPQLVELVTTGQATTWVVGSHVVHEPGNCFDAQDQVVGAVPLMDLNLDDLRSKTLECRSHPFIAYR